MTNELNTVYHLIPDKKEKATSSMNYMIPTEKKN